MSTVQCMQCERALDADEPRHEVEGGVFCAECYDALRGVVARAIAAQSEGINYPMSALGGALGGLAGALVWWGFTVATNIAFGLVAVVIGYAVGHGVLRLGGHKRGQGLQILSVGIALVSFLFATYLVNWSYANQAMEANHMSSLPLVLPVEVIIDLMKAGFNPMDLLFLGIVLYEAWRIPAPLRLG